MPTFFNVNKRSVQCGIYSHDIAMFNMEEEFELTKRHLRKLTEDILMRKCEKDGTGSPVRCNVIPKLGSVKRVPVKLRFSELEPNKSHGVWMQQVDSASITDKSMVRPFIIVVLDTLSIADDRFNLNKLSILGDVKYYGYTSPEQVAERIKDANAVITNKVPVNAEAMSGAKNLYYIGVMATGYDNIDIEYAKNHKIVVTNVPKYSTYAVAQHTFALILDHYSKVAQYNNFVHNGGWQYTKRFSPSIYSTHEIQNKSIGIIGFGSIGHEVAKIAAAFNMQVLVYHPRPLSLSDKRKGYHRMTNFKKFLCYSDIVTIHCPLTDKTRHLFDSKTFDMCHSSMYLVNTSRGAIIDNDALYDALVNKKIAGAAIDVLDQEPMPHDCRLLKAPNLTITPHVAWAHTESKRRLINTVYYNLFMFITGRPAHVVN